MTEPTWLTFDEVVLIHDRVIARFGGSPGLRDENLLRSALARPRNLWSYGGEQSTSRLAASLGYGLAKNHAFIDGNKRAAAAGVAAFVLHNGFDLPLEREEGIDAYQNLAAGTISELDFAAFVEKHLTRR